MVIDESVQSVSPLRLLVRDRPTYSAECASRCPGSAGPSGGDPRREEHSAGDAHRNDCCVDGPIVASMSGAARRGRRVWPALDDEPTGASPVRAARWAR